MALIVLAILNIASCIFYTEYATSIYFEPGGNTQDAIEIMQAYSRQAIKDMGYLVFANYAVALFLFVYLWRKGDREKKLPKYSSNGGLKLDWVNGFEIKSNVSEDGMVIKANKEGLLSLSNHHANLAQSEVPTGTHIHLDSINSLEDGSDEIIIEKT